MLFRSQASGLLEVWDGGQGQPHRVSMEEFSQVSAARWCDATGEIVVTAIPSDGAQPNFMSGERGEFRLYRCVPEVGRWERVWSGYAHDPVCIPGGYAVHRGAGLTILDRDGVVQREVRVGRFNWGPPSLSVNYAGERVAWTRWVSDRQRPCVENLSEATSFQARNSVYRYGWWDDATLVYYLGGGLRLLDVTSGRSRALAFDLRRSIREQHTGAPPHLVELASAPKDDTWENFSELRVDEQSLWFTAQLSHNRSDGWVQGLFQLSRASQELTLHTWVEPGERIGAFAVLPDSSAVLRIDGYDGFTIVGRDRRTVGPSRAWLDAGWLPAQESNEPSFGHHQLPV